MVTCFWAWALSNPISSPSWARFWYFIAVTPETPAVTLTTSNTKTDLVLGDHRKIQREMLQSLTRFLHAEVVAKPPVKKKKNIEQSSRSWTGAGAPAPPSTKTPCAGLPAKKFHPQAAAAMGGQHPQQLFVDHKTQISSENSSISLTGNE